MAHCCDQVKTMFGPLSFPKKSEKKASLLKFDIEQNDINLCLFCDHSFNLPSQQDDLLTHLFCEHRLVVADVHLIASLKSYLDYWRVRFSSYPVTEFCTTMLMDVLPDGTPSAGEKYFLLSDVLPEDKLLRESLQQKRLEWVLERQAMEREDDSFTRGCLFCKLEYKGSRIGYINHLSQKHNIQLGRPENLVFIDKMLDVIEEKIERLQCIFCERFFKDRPVLKEHMRKKLHKRINPANTLYDKFYIVNYLEIGKSWQEVQSEPDPPDSKVLDAQKDDWSDWDDEDGEESVTCLFCEESNSEFDEILKHLKTVHNFDFMKLCKEQQLDFYSQVKVVNYIRHRVHERRCIVCDEKHVDLENLIKHMEDGDHLVMPPVYLWNQPEYFFPTYENDTFLCYLDDTTEDEFALCTTMKDLGLNTTAV